MEKEREEKQKKFVNHHLIQQLISLANWGSRLYSSDSNPFLSLFVWIGEFGFKTLNVLYNMLAFFAWLKCSKIVFHKTVAVQQNSATTAVIKCQSVPQPPPTIYWQPSFGKNLWVWVSECCLLLLLLLFLISINSSSNKNVNVVVIIVHINVVVFVVIFLLKN